MWRIFVYKCKECCNSTYVIYVYASDSDYTCGWNNAKISSNYRSKFQSPMVWEFLELI